MAKVSAAQAENPLAKPAADTVDLQEVGERLSTAAPITALAAHGGSMYAVINGALHTISGKVLAFAPGRVGDFYSVQLD